MRFSTSALAVAVILAGAAAAADIKVLNVAAAAETFQPDNAQTAVTNDAGRGGLRKDVNRRRRLQNRSIVCEAQGGVGQSGLVPTAPSYTDCYLNGCPSTYACTDSSQCAAGSCCMPTSWVFYGNYCVSVAQLDNLNQYAKRKCLCREAERAGAGNAGDAVISGGQVTILGDEEDVQQDSTNTEGGVSGTPQQQQQQQQQQTTTTTTTTTTGGNANTNAGSNGETAITTACNGCMFDGKCVPTGVAWMRRDGCTRCYCKSSDGSGDYRCIDSSCPTTATAATTTTGNKPTQEIPNQGQVEPAKEVTPTPTKTQPTTEQTNIEQQESYGEPSQNQDENNAQSPAGQTSDNTPTTNSNLQSQPEAQTRPQAEVSSPQPPKCTGCTVNGLCLPTGAQWVLTEGSCNRRCVCFNKDQSGEHRCAPCPQDFAASGSSPAVPVTELNNNNNNAQEGNGSGTASASAKSTGLVPGFGEGSEDIIIGEEDGGGLFSEKDLLDAELDILNQPLLPP